MSETGIMSGINQIPYDKVNVMETLKEEANLNFHLTLS